MKIPRKTGIAIFGTLYAKYWASRLVFEKEAGPTLVSRSRLPETEKPPRTQGGFFWSSGRFGET